MAVVLLLNLIVFQVISGAIILIIVIITSCEWYKNSQRMFFCVKT